MLTRLHKILIGALAVQIVLMIAVRLRGGGGDAPIGERPLLAGVDPATATAVKVFGDGHDKADVELTKTGNDWVVASHWSYPAEAAKVTDMLTPIGKMAAAEPIATSAAYHKQLRVGDKDFDRKLVVTAGGKDYTIFVGGAAGTRRTAVRLGGDDNVYAVTGVSTFSINIAARDWVKRDYYAVTKDDIQKIVVERGTQKIELERTPPPPPAGSGSGSGSGSAPPAPSQETEWKVTIDGAPVVATAPERLDTMRIGDLIGDVGSIPAIPADPKRDAAQPVATITVYKKAGTDKLVVVADGDQYWVKQDGNHHATLVPKAELEKVVTVARDKLVTKPDPNKPPDDPANLPPGGLPPGMQMPPGFDLEPQ